jgi:hypothetical protein
MTIGSFLKGLSLTAILMSVPAFAVFGLMAHASHRPAGVELASEHDPLQTGFRFARKSVLSGSETSVSAQNDESLLLDYRFTAKPVPSPYTAPLPPGYPVVPKSPEQP